MAHGKPPTTLPASSSTASLAHSGGGNNNNNTHGLRSQLGHILPKHALFHVQMHVEQLSNVPLVSGEFGVRWKFRNVQSGAGLLSKMKNRSTSSTSIRRGDKGKERMAPPEIAIHGESGGRLSVDEDTRSESSGSAVYGQFLSTSPPDSSGIFSATPTTARAMVFPEKGSEARGMTEWVTLKNYTARWDHYVDVVVQMDVHRETSDLLPCELKLVAMQRVVHGDPNAPHQPRLGAIYINLAEYACQGPVTRRYLLRESKTNATLKLTIEVEHVGGEQHFTPPPLRKGEIMASVTGILNNNDLYNSHLARDLDIYARPEDEDWVDENFPAMPATPYWSAADGQIDFDRLASSNGLRTTESLIDAIFNPVPTTNEMQTPFTYYDPDRALEAAAAERQSIHGSIDSGNTEGSSHPSSLSSAASDHSSGSLPGAGGLDLQKHWWQKMRSSRPSTPVDRQFRPPAHQAASFPRLPS
ncbi:hypothetical protein BDW22DRAFT_1484503 [Trametopsis cervina]|nr:hypothetical protein BDW22DRAFT_1484503 [Trametopsis cervina]